MVLSVCCSEGHGEVAPLWRGCRDRTRCCATGSTIGGQAIEERTGTVAAAATVATVLSVQYIWSGGTPVCRFSYNASGALVQTLYYMTDANNNVTAIVDNTPLVNGTTNPNYGQVVERYVYDAYGTATFLDANWQPTVVTGHADGTTSAYGNNILYGCYTLNVETEMYSTQTRYYVPWLAVFASQDSVWSTNLYTYCRDNPGRYSDPSGQTPIYTIKPGETAPEWVPKDQIVTDWGADYPLSGVSTSMPSFAEMERSQKRWNAICAAVESLQVQYWGNLSGLKAEVESARQAWKMADDGEWDNNPNPDSTVGKAKAAFYDAVRAQIAFEDSFTTAMEKTFGHEGAVAWRERILTTGDGKQVGYYSTWHESNCRLTGLQSDMTPIILISAVLTAGLDAPIAFGAEAASGSGRLVHLTNSENGALIDKSLTLVGNNYAGPLSNAGRSGFGVTLRTGLWPTEYEAAVSIPAAGEGAFMSVTPVGPLTTWQWATGQAYTANGVLDLTTGGFIRTGINWNQVKIYGIDIGLDAAAIGGAGYVINNFPTSQPSEKGR